MSQDEQEALFGISQFLERMKIPAILQKIGNENGETFPALTCNYRIDKVDFSVIIYNVGSWINVKCLVMETKGMSIEDRAKIFELALTLNYELPETTFSAYQGNLYIEIDCLVDVDYDDFKSEFNSIADGLNAFVEMLQTEKNIKLTSTKWKDIVMLDKNK
jgi:hypothetical protein